MLIHYFSLFALFGCSDHVLLRNHIVSVCNLNKVFEYTVCNMDEPLEKTAAATQCHYAHEISLFLLRYQR